MPNTSATAPSHNLRNPAIEAINRAMARFPLIVRTLRELRGTDIPLPGDDDLRHGCQRALTAILGELSRIPVAPAGKPCKAEEIARNWLHTAAAGELIDADQLQRIQMFIDNILSADESLAG